MKSHQVDSCLTCELKIIGAKNININVQDSLLGHFFVRCYLSTGNNQKVQLNTQEITIPSSSKLLVWNESFSLDCQGSEENINLVKETGDVVFELRWRRKFPAAGRCLGRLWNSSSSSSKLLARAQVPWKLCFESPNMGIEKWVFMEYSKKGMNLHDEDSKPPALQIAMKVKAEEKIRRKRWGHDDKCGCMDGGDHGCNNYCADYEFVALGEAF